jgi:flagellar protein FlaG
MYEGLKPAGFNPIHRGTGEAAVRGPPTKGIAMINSAAPPGLQGPAMPPQAPVPLLGSSQVEHGAASARPNIPERPAEPFVKFDPRELHENLKHAIDELNKQLADSGRSLGIRMDDVLNTPVVTVKSTRTGEVIRQIPSEAVLKVAHTFEQLKGLLVDETS